MIVLSNHGDSDEYTLADRMREISISSMEDRLNIFKDRLTKELRIASINGKVNLNFIIVEKDGGVFISKDLINKFEQFIIESGFEVDVKYINEEDITDPFYLFHIKW